MSLFIEQANLGIPTTKTIEMIKVSIILRYFWKKYLLFEANTNADTQKADIGRYQYFGTSLMWKIRLKVLWSYEYQSPP